MYRFLIKLALNRDSNGIMRSWSPRHNQSCHSINNKIGFFLSSHSREEIQKLSLLVNQKVEMEETKENETSMKHELIQQVNSESLKA
jgi:hypothetical protein